MKRALIFVLSSLLTLTIATGAVFAQKKKFKEKRYEPASHASLKDYEGKYVGIEASYFIEIVVSGDGKLSIRSHEGAREATLKEIRVAGAYLTATKVYADGGSEKFHGMFANRILNGVSAFGIFVDGMHVELEGLTLTSIFYRLSEAGSSSNASYAHAPDESEASIARQEIEARYRELSEAVRNKDFAAFQALRTKDFAARLPDGNIRGSAQMAARAATLLNGIQAPISLSNQIELLILMDNEAIAIVHQKFSRAQEIAGRLHTIETSTTQRETWVKTGDGW
ncbi:MAG TPA: nuclear transport factor 2 family protein, partial [Pyrinomonadaceae bacterium]